MRYAVIDARESAKGRKGQILLRRLSWNDWWQFKTTFYVSYVRPDGRAVDIGSVKVAKIDHAYVKDKSTGGDWTPVPDEFKSLTAGFVSVGQDESYYTNLLEVLGAKAHSVLDDLNDLAYNPQMFQEVHSTPVVNESLLRDVPSTSVTGTYRRIIDGGTDRATYDFTYVKPTRGPEWLVSPLELNFEVHPNSTPPTNVHVLIGRNGSGKTTLLSSLTRAMLGIGNEDDGFVTGMDGSMPPVANLVHIGFSAFDVVDIPVRDDPLEYNVAYAYVGLHYVGAKRDESENPDKAEDLSAPKRTRPASALGNAFARSAWKVISEKSRDLWRSSLENLESDPNFADAQVSALAEYSLDQEAEFRAEARALFERLSSGHKIVLLSVTRLVETVAEQSLVLIDEPEGHLHPPLLSAFIRTLSDLMQTRNGMAIIATHSPVILQEVPRKCVWRISRNGTIQTADRPDKETFGENVGMLTNAVFGLEVTASGFHRMLREAALAEGSYEAVLQKFDDELGFEARALLRSWFAANLTQ